MYLYFDINGTLKEIITERPFRVGDSARDKIYIYWEGDHSVSAGWVKYRLPNNSYTNETQFFDSDSNLVGKELPANPPRNLKYFSYDHTYEEDGVQKSGYLFYEITVPDNVLGSGDGELYPEFNNLIVARVRFVISGNTVALGAIPFSVETNVGILTDNSIDESQYNYLIKMISENPNMLNNDKSISYDINSEGVVDGYYASGSKVVTASTVHKCLKIVPFNNSFSLSFETLTSADATPVNIEFEDGTVKALAKGLAHNFLYHFVNVKALYVNFLNYGTENAQVEQYNLEYDYMISKESSISVGLPIVALKNKATLTTKNATVYGRYDISGTSVVLEANGGNQWHQALALDFDANKKYSLSFTVGSGASTSLKVVIIAFADGTLQSITGSASVSNLSIENATKIYLNFYHNASGDFITAYDLEYKGEVKQEEESGKEILSASFSGVEYGYYQNNASTKTSSSSHKCLKYTPKAQDLTLKFTVATVQSITYVNVEFLDGTVRALPYGATGDYVFSFTNVKAIYANFYSTASDFEVEIDYNDALSKEILPASNLPIFAIGKTYNLTIKNATDAGYYTLSDNTISISASYPNQKHQCAKIKLNGKKCYLSFDMGSTSTSLKCAIIEYEDGTFGSIAGSADVANYSIENGKYLYLNFFRGSTAGQFPETYIITDATDNVHSYEDYTDNEYSWSGKKAVCAGDSISTALNGGTAWPAKFAEAVGCTMYNLAISGAFYTPELYHSELVADLKTQLTNYTGTKSAIDYVFIAGGTNDYWWSADLEDFADAVGDTIDYALENYPNAKIIIITPIAFNGQSANTENIQTYRNIITEVAMQKDTAGRITIVQGYKFNFGTKPSDYTTAMQYDGVHPTQLGLKTAYLKGLLKILNK